MSELDECQKVIRDTLEGMIVVDAGPGTGKTHTIVQRYIKLISKPDVSPKDVLLLTFTNNAAEEMEDRIKVQMVAAGLERDSKFIQASTFDAFCLSIVMDSPDMVSSFFGFKETLTRSATLVENRSLNVDYFSRFLDGFLILKREDYGDIATIASENPVSVLDLIENLMSRGLIPLKNGWFGNGADRILKGDLDKLRNLVNGKNQAVGGKRCEILGILSDKKYDGSFGMPDTSRIALTEQELESIVVPDREELFRFIHDVYYDYIRQCISDNRLTFGINAMLAFTLLYKHRSVRERNSFRYLMVDEFQDTNANQLMICLMLLKEPNLCVVGDWKQGIYGFRYVSTDNIVHFEEKAVECRRFLNDDVVRIPFHIPEVIQLPLTVSHRSSKVVLDKAFQAICIRGTKEDDPQ